MGLRNPAFLPWQSYAAVTLAGLGRPEEGRPYADAGLEAARRWGTPDAVGLGLRAVGRTREDPAEAEQYLRESVEVLRDSYARLEYAWALRDLGAFVRRRNKRSEARELLREALDLAHRAGATPLAEDVQAELAATGAKPRRLVVTGVDALTASERRVAELAAQSLTNKDIALGALRDAEDSRSAPEQRLSQARDRLAGRTWLRARRARARVI